VRYPPVKPARTGASAGRLLAALIVLAALAAPVRGGAAVPPLVLQVESEAGLPIARLCERIWTEHGAALAADILPRGAVADTVLCLVLPSDRFAAYFADRLPDWGVGVALPPGRVIALDFERIPHVGPGPAAVFLHEMAHALLFQAAGEIALPTWLHEGVAMRAAGQWRVVDTLGIVLGGQLPSLGALSGPFPRGAASADRAYRTSLLAVNWLEREHGPGAVPRVVAAARQSGDFHAGFTAATGESPEAFARRFAAAMQVRFGWFLLLFRWPTLFVIMALLFSVGAVRKIVAYRRSLRQEDDTDLG
jgi:hypothetical protein